MPSLYRLFGCFRFGFLGVFFQYKNTETKRDRHTECAVKPTESDHYTGVSCVIFFFGRWGGGGDTSFC